MQVFEVNGNNSKMFAQINLILRNLKFFFLDQQPKDSKYQIREDGTIFETVS